MVLLYHWVNGGSGYKTCLSQWDAGTYTLTCLTPKAGTLPLARGRPIKIQIRIRFLRHLKSQQQKWSEVEWEETVKRHPAACPTQSPEPSLGTGSALSVSWRSSVWCVCFSLLEESSALHWASAQLYNFQGPPGLPWNCPCAWRPRSNPWRPPVLPSSQVYAPYFLK